MDEMITGLKPISLGLHHTTRLMLIFSTWGKSISNGFSFAAMTGKSKIMDLGSIKESGKEKVFHEFHYSWR